MKTNHKYKNQKLGNNSNLWLQYTTILQRLPLGHRHYPCQTFADAQFVAMAVGSAFYQPQRPRPKPVRSSVFRIVQPFRSKSGALPTQQSPPCTSRSSVRTLMTGDSRWNVARSVMFVQMARTSVFGCLASWPRGLATVCDFASLGGTLGCLGHTTRCGHLWKC